MTTSHVSKQSIIAEISGRSTDNYHGTANISETAMINALLVDIREALFILLRMSLN